MIAERKAAMNSPPQIVKSAVRIPLVRRLEIRTAAILIEATNKSAQIVMAEKTVTGGDKMEIEATNKPRQIAMATCAPVILIIELKQVEATVMIQAPAPSACLPGTGFPSSAGSSRHL